MKKGIALILATASAGALATPALAQDANPFTGPRAEVLLGYDIAQAGSSVDNDVNENDDQSIDGLTYGAGIGYDFAAGENLVVGLEGEYLDSTAKTEFTAGDFENIGLGGRVDAGRDLYVGARVGYRVAPTTLVYAKGGYSNARFNILARDGETETRRDIDTDGFRVGAGIEQAVSDNVFAKVEYRYSNYSEGEIDFRDDIADSDRFNVDLDRHQIMAGVGVRF